MNGILYQFKSLPVFVKVLVIGIPTTLFACMCLFVGLLGSLGAAVKSHSTPTAIAAQVRGKPIAKDQAQQIAEATQTPSFDSAATSTVEAQATEAAFAPFATQTAIITSAGSQPPQDGNYLFADQTSHSVSIFSNAYLFWGGAGSLGFPLTEPFIEKSPVDGKGYWVQYFEKGVAEYHNGAPDGQVYQLASLGAWRFKEKYPNGAPATKPLPGQASHLFTETNHTVKDPFLKYWTDHGQVQRFGYPISETFEEKSDADGKLYTVQYFERAVLEYHPELSAANNVQQTAVGALRLRAAYPDGAPMAASNPIPSPTINAPATAAAVATATQLAQEAIAHATATAQTKAAYATSTAEAKATAAAVAQAQRAYDSYKYTAPSGDFHGSSSDAGIWARLQYQNCISYWCASNGGKYILVGVTVNNLSYSDLHVNPIDFTLVSTEGASVAIDTQTFALGNYLDAVDVAPGDYTTGWMAFLVSKNFIPGRLLWRGFLADPVRVTIVEKPN